MKVIFTSDLHGEIHLYQELFSEVLSSSVEIIALGGDLLPSFPPTKQYEDIIPDQKAFIDQFLLPLLKRMLETTFVNQIFLIPGNWDLSYPHLFKEKEEGIIDLSQKSYRSNNGYEWIGYPFVPPTPFRPKDFEKMDDPQSPWPPQKDPSFIKASDQTDQLIPIDPHGFLRQRETIREDLGRLPKPLLPKRSIFVMHSPPFGTRLDIIQSGEFAGSRSIKTFIEKHQPLLTLHGHIHESPDISGHYSDRIGETISVNPGQSIWKGKDFLKLYAVTFEIEKIQETLRHTCF
jgi:Icc-related predicted phosphoesterase